jgi:alpha-tubulin suppressor-like RCC1 family protein
VRGWVAATLSGVLAFSAAAGAVSLTTAPAVAAVDTTSVKPSPTTIAVADNHSAFLDASGRPWAFGDNTFGQLTDAVGAEGTAVPTLMSGLPAGVTGISIAPGDFATLVVGSDGRVYATGRNQSSSLTGVGQLDTLTPMTGLPPTVSAIDAASGTGRSIVLGDDGVLYGVGTAQVASLPGVPGSVTTLWPMTALPNGDVPASVYAGYHNFAVIAADGSVYGTGYNGSGQLTGTGPASSWTEFAGLPPGYVATSVALGVEHSAVLLGDGSLWSSGNNGFGQFGQVSAGSATPVQAPGVPGLVGISAYQATGHATMAVAADGTVYGAGYNAGGLGNLSSPVTSFTAVPEASPLGTVTEVALGGGHSLVRDSAGVIHATGAGNPAGGTKSTLALVVGQPLTATADAAIEGDPYVGEQLSANGATWAPAVGTSSWQWHRDGDPIAGADQATYTVTGADLGAALTVTETRSQVGFLAGTSTSAPTVTVTDPPLTSTGGAVAISGTATVGETISATSDIAWSAAPDAVTYQWMRGTTPVGAPTTAPQDRVLAAGDVGATITLVVRATKTGYVDGVATSNAVGPVAPGTFASTPQPWVSGPGRVGSTLTSTVPAATPSATTTTRTWLRDGVAIPGATGASYTLTRADAGRRVAVRVQVARAGYLTPAPTISSPVPVAAVNTKAPSFRGKAVVGRKLRASRGTWFGAGYTYSVQWLRNGKAIRGATAKTYVLTAKDMGKRISLRVVATKPGFATVRKVSAARTVS